MARLLLLEDDIILCETLCEFLEENGHEVVCVHDGQSAQDVLYEERFDALLLDVNVPNLDGFSLLKQARQSHNTTPAIFMTSLNALGDLEQGFRSGCDDYIRKPFALKELLLRLENLLKRPFGHVESLRIRLDAHWSFDVEGNTLYNDQTPYPLQRKEGELLKFFLQHRGEIVSHETLLNVLWSYDETPSDGALRTYIKTLRKRIGKEKIVSFKKLGYKFTTA